MPAGPQAQIIEDLIAYINERREVANDLMNADDQGAAEEIQYDLLLTIEPHIYPLGIWHEYDHPAAETFEAQYRETVRRW